MAKPQGGRKDHEQGMLNNIGGRDEPLTEPAAPAPSASKPTGWMVYVGGTLWMTALCVTGLVAWLFLTRGG